MTSRGSVFLYSSVMKEESVKETTSSHWEDERDIVHKDHQVSSHLFYEMHARSYDCDVLCLMAILVYVSSCCLILVLRFPDILLFLYFLSTNFTPKGQRAESD